VRSFACLLAAVAVLVCACGGEGPLTKREYRHEASAICRRGNARVQRIEVAPLVEGRSAAKGISRVVDTQRESLSDLRDIKPPKNDVVTIERWLAVVDQLLDEADAVRAALLSSDQPRAHETAGRALVLDQRAGVLARRYGIHPCRVRRASLGV
jgi:hypothetical protein